MQGKFESHNFLCDVECFHNENSDVIRFYDSKNELYKNSLSDLVIVEPSYGILLIQYIGDDEIILRNAFTYFSQDLMQASKEIEASWNRRDIHIYHKNGKILYDWQSPF